MLYSHHHRYIYIYIYIYIYTCTCKIHIDAMNKDEGSLLQKNIPLTLFERVVSMRGSWRPNRSATY